MPDDEGAVFKIIRSPILQKGLSNKYPTYQSYKIIDKENPFLQGRMTWTDKGLYVHLNEKGQSIFIESISVEGSDNLYIVYQGKDKKIERRQDLICGNSLFKNFKQTPFVFEEKIITDADFKTFRLAITSTEQFTNSTGGTIELALSSIINILTSLNVIYERDLAIRFLLQEDNERLIFTDENPAPFSDMESAFELWDEHPFLLDSILGADNYDIGHVFATDCTGGVTGLAYLAGVCSENKASGVTCLFDDDLVDFRKTLYHEVGHQLGANHTWSNCGEGTNEDQRHAPTAVEPGGGSTIMSYGGICGPFNIVGAPQDNLHGISILEIKQTLASDTITCYDQIPIENTSPVVSVRMDSFVIPILTPFELMADAFDDENSSLTYSWEQFDTGTISEVGFPIGSAPSFRAFVQTKNPLRVFPRVTDIILNRASTAEVLPDTSRNLTFGVTVRDNNEKGGSTSFAKVAFSASAEAGPFLVMQPDSANIEYQEGDSIEILWDVANTNQPPVNCARIDVYLSFNNGQEFTKLLAEQIPNNGLTKVLLPDTTTNRARIKVKCSDNIFFDISNNRFKILEKISTSTKNYLQEQLKLYPNPAKEEIYLKFPKPLQKAIYITIFDALGRTVLQEKISSNRDFLYLNTRQLTRGLYFIKGKIGDQTFIKRFIIQK